ncbi:uncharacterized protein si:dkey-27h10.2 [Tachysurus vachellii]|uniref:uncharacterized protein si:dkey-27h10.2 n=1 Tax=Tachysurus vachellii TaxID=175792 RepID=UPI00296B1066|nr:uncharacterized protein si:dkey-27h10.2 [Tachysurus vachellii]
MKKMSVTFYVLTIFGTLLVPMVSMGEDTSSDIQDTSSGIQNKSSDIQNTSSVIQNKSSDIQNTSSDIQNTSSDIQNTSSDIQNTSSETQNTSFVNKSHSEDVDNVTNAFDPNITKAENSTALSTQVPPTKEYPSNNPSDVDITTKKTGDVNRTTMKSTTTKEPNEESPRSSVYIFVLLFVILAVAVLGIIFFCVKSNRKRFSVDIHDKHEDAQIPLASVEQEMCESSSKGADMKTFTTEESSPTDNIEETEEQKAPTEGDKQTKESPAQSEAPAEKPAGSTIEDDAASNKTSMETLDDVLNENNSNNNNAVSDVSVCFIDICLND